jgi:hypothetical protein
LTTLKKLEDALHEILQDHHKISKFDAQAIRELILADGKVSREEKLFLERALKDDVFDEKAYEILSQLLLRAEST